MAPSPAGCPHRRSFAASTAFLGQSLRARCRGSVGAARPSRVAAPSRCRRDRAATELIAAPPRGGALRCARKSARRWREADARGVTWHSAACPMAGSEMQGSGFFTKRARAASVYKASLRLSAAELVGWRSGRNAVKPSGKPSSRVRPCRGCQSAPR